MATILIIDDHQIYLDGLEMIFNQKLPDCQILKAINLPSALSVINENKHIDLILLDLNLHQQDGFEIWKQIKAEFGPLPFAILSASEKQKDILKCKQLGALGFINKAIDNQNLIGAIQSVLNGELFFPYSLSQSPEIHLTRRQKDVLTLLAEGLPNKLICRKLEMSEATVKTHLRNLFALLEVNTRTQCVTVASKFDLI